MFERRTSVELAEVEVVSLFSEAWLDAVVVGSGFDGGGWSAVAEFSLPLRF